MTTSEESKEPDGPKPPGPTQPPPGEDALLRQLREALPGPISHSSLRFFRPGGRERPQPAPGLTAGKQVGDFRLVSLIGQGGMGQVWEAEQVSLHRRVAVKFVRPERVTERQLELFAREARAGGRLSHPGIVTVHGYGQSEGLAWIAMEFIEGAWTLKDFLDEVARADEVPEGYDRHVARFVAEIADAMQAAHEAGVIHRDLKPQNVLITEGDRPKVTDFGLARITDETAMSQTGDFAGTYYYMSPEQVTARRMGIDHRTDVFSLGIVLYELLALRRPFEGDTSHQVAAQIVTKDPPEIRTIRSRVPRDLAVIAGKALEKDRDRRYQTMKELAADLRRHLANEPIHATPPTRLDRLVKWTRRNPAKSVAAGITAVGFVIVSGLSVALYAKSEESEQRRVAAEESAEREKQAADLAKKNELRALAGEEQARNEKDRADREADTAKRNEALATARADDVLRLSAMQKLADLEDEAERLWPAHPENIERYERWLSKAAELAAELPDHEKKLAELRTKARAWTAEEQAEFRATHPRAKDLERLERALAFWKARTAVLESGEPGPEPTAAEVGIDFAALPADANGLKSLAWPLVDPERTSFGDERRGLVLARRAVELAGDAERAGIRDTLAWAHFALARFDDAAAEEEQALEEAPGDRKAEFEGYVAKLHAAIEAELAPEAFEKAQGRLSDLEAELASIEGELSTRPEWTFDDDQDKWWHNQLEKLVTGIRTFADEETGLVSEGASPKHGWGVKRRLTNATRLNDGFARGGQYSDVWENALPAIRAAYPDLALTAQLGLVPIGPDPRSGLWEFAHLETGAVVVREGDGSLGLTEETGLVFVLLPSRAFEMGAQNSDPSSQNYDPAAKFEEQPVHEVRVHSFFISKYEMTQAQWRRVAGGNPSFYHKSSRYVHSDLHPVEHVSWDDCQVTLTRLGLGLPTEAQWEYAARGGTTTSWWTGGQRQSLAGQANLADQSASRAGALWAEISDWPELDDEWASHAPAGTYPANGFGIHEVAGNVGEWCFDQYASYVPQVASSVAALTQRLVRVYRGGFFTGSARHARSAARAFATPSYRADYIGVRPVQELN